MLRLIIVTQIILQRDFCPPLWPLFFSLFSDGCLKNVNTNVKVAMSQNESGFLSFAERHFSNRQAYQQDLTALNLWVFKSKWQVEIHSVQKWYSSGALREMIKKHLWCRRVGYDYIDLSWDENAHVTIGGNMICFSLCDCSPSSGISSAPSTLPNHGCFGWHRLKWGWKEKVEMIILFTDT